MTKKWIKKLSKNVFEKRIALDLTQQELAYRAKLSITTIYKVERGEMNDVKLSVIVGIAESFGTENPFDLFK